MPIAVLGFARIDHRRLIATGSGGGVAITADDGQTWEPACIPSSAAAASLEDVSFLPDGQHGWIVGTVGYVPAHALSGGGVDGSMVILRTSDGGAHWEAGSVLHPKGYLKSVTFIDALHGWAVGDKGSDKDGFSRAVVLRSIDGGITWIEGRLDDPAPGDAEPFQLQAVTFVDRQRGWAVGPYTILRTTDGGATWMVQSFNYGGYGTFFGDVAFSDAEHGWVVGSNHPLRDQSNGLIMETTDGGRNWSRQTFSPVTEPGTGSGPLFKAIEALSDQVVVLVSDRGPIWRSTDGGHQWEQIADLVLEGPTGGSDVSGSVQHALFTDAEHGVLSWRFLDDKYPPQFCVTSDGGRTWEGRSISGPPFNCKNRV